jgi:hypothetical protein
MRRKIIKGGWDAMRKQCEINKIDESQEEETSRMRRGQR